MSKYTVQIPLSRIDKIQLYINTRKKALASIKSETGADYIINGGFFNMDSFTPCGVLIADGNTFVYEWSGEGYCFDSCPPALRWSDRSDKNFIYGVPLVVNGKTRTPLNYAASWGGTRGRTAIGVAGDKLCLYCSGDGTRDAKTPEGLRDEVASLGWDSAVMLDGGGSSQCDFAGQRIISDRAVHNLILVYLKEENPMKKVCLDPGHGKETAGKCSPDKTYYEHEFALDMAKRMKPILERHGVEVTLTRTTEKTLTGGATSAESNARVAIANAITGLDLYVSIHSNAAGNDGWYSAKGLSVITSAAGATASRNIAANAIIARFKEAGITLRNPALTHDIDIIVLRKTVAPAVLIEHGFHTNQDEVALLKTSEYRDKLAVAECKGILDYLGIAWVDDYAAVVQKRFSLADETMKYLESYQYAGDLFKALATKE